MLIVSDRLRKSDGERAREIERAKQSKLTRQNIIKTVKQ